MWVSFVARMHPHFSDALFLGRRKATFHTAEAYSSGKMPTLITRCFGLELSKDESRIAWSLFWAHFLILAFQYIAKSVRQANFLDSLGSESLPFVYLLVALATLPALRLHNLWVDRWPLSRVLAISSLCVAAGTGVFWWLLDFDAPWIRVLFFVWVAVVGILLVSQLWMFASQLLDPRQAKRLFGFIGGGGLLGAISGGQIASWSSRLLNPLAGLVFAVLALLAVATIIAFLGKIGSQSSDSVATKSPTSLRDRLAIEQQGASRAGLKTLWDSRYLRALSLLVLVSAAVSQVVDLQFSWAVEQSTSTLVERTALFGHLYSVIGVAGLLFQMIVTTRALTRWGVGLTLYALPVSSGLAGAFFGMAAFVAPTLLLPAAWLVKTVDNGLRYSLDQSTRELLFMPVAEGMRAKVKALLDVFVQRAGKSLAAIGLLSVALGWIPVAATTAIALPLVALWLVLVAIVHRRYVDTFREGLPNERWESAEKKVERGDVRSLELLIAGLGSSDSSETLHSLELLRLQGRGHLVPPWLVRHSDPVVRKKTVEILDEIGRQDAEMLVRELLCDSDAEVRLAATRALPRLPADESLRSLIEDSSYQVRASAISRLAESSDCESRDRALELISERLSSDRQELRLEAACVLSALDDPKYQGSLIQLLYDQDAKVVVAALEAVTERASRRGGNPLYLPTLVSLLHDRRLKHAARRALVAYGESVLPTLEFFLADAEEPIWVRRAVPRTIASIGGSRAVDALLGGLEAADPFLRRKVIEALVDLRRKGDGEPERELILNQLRAESKGYLRRLAQLETLSPEPLAMRGPFVEWSSPPHLLLSLLADRLRQRLERVFGLLALLHPPKDVMAALRGLESEDSALAARAIEYLENLLGGQARELLFALIEPPSSARGSDGARQEGRAASESPEEILRHLVGERPEGDADAAWISAAALDWIHNHGLRQLEPLIEHAATHDPSSLVQETAAALMPKTRFERMSRSA